MSRSFDGSNDKLAQSPPVLAAPFTFACFYTVAAFTSLRCLYCLGGELGSANQSHWIAVNTNGTLQACTRTTSTATATTSTSDTTTNKWLHGCGVFASAADRRIFLNGGGKGTNTTNRAPTDALSLQLGEWLSGSNDHSGLIAHPAIWNVALDDDEVAALGVGVSPLLIRPQSLVRYWPYLGRDTDDVDIVGGTTLTATGTTSSPNEPPLLWVPGRRRIFIPVSAGGTQTREVTAEGGIVFAGAGLVERRRTLNGAGGLSLSGAATAARARTASPSGGLVFGGAADYSTSTGGGTSTREVVASGGIVFAGAAGLTRQRTLSAVGGVTLSGAATQTKQRAIVGAGGLQIAGAATLSKQRVVAGAGGLSFSGVAAYSTHQSTRTVVASGGITFGGAAQVSFPSVAVENWIAGTAVDGTGLVSTVYLSDGVSVPGGSVFLGGIAHSPEGARYICSWPTIQTVSYHGGRAVRADGALVCAIAMTVAGHYSGFGLSYRGESYISLSTEGKFKDGVGIRTAGQLPVSDNS